MGIDITNLKELAERAESTRPDWYTEDGNNWFLPRDCMNWIAAANPQAILGLIAEVERLRNQVGPLALGAEQAMDERERLKAENEALRTRLKALIHISDATGWEDHTCGEISKARAALEGDGR